MADSVIHLPAPVCVLLCFVTVAACGEAHAYCLYSTISGCFRGWTSITFSRRVDRHQRERHGAFTLYSSPISATTCIAPEGVKATAIYFGTILARKVPGPQPR